MAEYASGKEPAYPCRRSEKHRFSPWVGKIPWRRKWQPTLVLLPGESYGQRGLVGYSPQGRKESDTTGQLSTSTYNARRDERIWTPNSRSYSKWNTERGKKFINRASTLRLQQVALIYNVISPPWWGDVEQKNISKTNSWNISKFEDNGKPIEPRSSMISKHMKYEENQSEAHHNRIAGNQ